MIFRIWRSMKFIESLIQLNKICHHTLFAKLPEKNGPYIVHFAKHSCTVTKLQSAQIMIASLCLELNLINLYRHRALATQWFARREMSLLDAHNLSRYMVSAVAEFCYLTPILTQIRITLCTINIVRAEYNPSMKRK